MKRTIRNLLAWTLTLVMLFPLAACGASNMGMENNYDNGNYPNADAGWPDENLQYAGEKDDIPNDEKGDTFVENPFVATEENNVSTLSADVDTASYTYFRKLVNSGYTWEELNRYSSSFRTEEFINYFKYDAPQPNNTELFAVNSTVLPCPWNENTVLLSMTLQAQTAAPAAGNNLVFLIDVSGSMSSPDKLPLLKQAFSHLTEQLTENDTVSIVTYSGNERVILEGCAGNKKETILSAIATLEAGGSTNGQAGMQKAYLIAERYRIEGGNNRIIMASDGDLNVGISSASELETYISQKRESGIFLSVLGFGTGNYRDTNMETIADCGNGVYLYIDGASEAEKVFSTDLLANLYTVAKDVKMQITFDKGFVSSYRLIGYENRLLNEEDFTDDTKDAGEVGAGHQVTVCYELTLAEGAMTEGSVWLDLAVNYKKPDESVAALPKMHFIGYADYRTTPTEDHAFMLAVIELCMLLHDSKYLPADFDLADVLENLSALDLSNHPERAEFRTLIAKLTDR